MATIQEIIERVDERKPNAFSQKAKIAWIAELDGKIAADVMLMNINDVRQFNYAYPENLSSEPLIEFPHDSIYDLWLGAKIDFENGEYTKYQNSMEQYNAHYNNFVHWFTSTYEPAQGYVCSANENPPYYITAYALAVKSGFKGTLNEWIESLQGDKVEFRYLEDKIQWRWIPNTGAVEGTSDVENVGLENDFQWHDLINVATIRGEIINHILQTATGAAQSAKTSEENAKRYAESIKPPVYLVTFSDTNDANIKWCKQEYSSIMAAHLAGLSVKCQHENFTLPLVQVGDNECIFGATVGTKYLCIVLYSDRNAIVWTRSMAPLYLVTINDSGTAEQSYADRMAAYQSGYVIQCDYLGTRLPLKAVVDMDFMFSGITDRTSYHVVVRSNGSTVINERSLASQTDIPRKVSDLEDAGDYLTEAPVTSVNGLNGDVSTATKVSLTEQADGSYLSDLSSAEIMAAYRDHKTVHCYHQKMILPLIRSVVNDAVFSGIYDGQIHTVNVASNRMATVTVIPLASGGGSDGITPHIGANGNWWIGEEDTGVSAGVTDEQISGAVEKYMEENPLGGGADGLYFDETTWTLYLMSRGQSIGNGVQLPTTGDGPTNNAVLTLANTTGWTSMNIPNSQHACTVSFDWSSVEGNVSTGDGTLALKVAGELRHTAKIRQGEHTLNILDYLSIGYNLVHVTVTDFYGNSQTIPFGITMYDPAALKSTKLVERTLTGDYTNDRATKIGAHAFAGLTLNQLSLPSVTEVAENGFNNLTVSELELASLTETTSWMFRDGRFDVVKVPSVAKMNKESLFAWYINRMVLNCVNLETVGDVLTSKNNVGTFDFHRLKSLPRIPGGSTRNVIIRTPEVCALQTAPGTTSVNVYFPASTVDSYKSETNWSAMADQIFAIEDHPDICEVSDDA